MRPKEKIAALRQLMLENQIDAWIVPSADPHQSEYVADCWKARAWISGFAGSAGTVVVTKDKAGLWTDSRYHIRAAKELAGSGIELFKMGLSNVPSLTEWLQKELCESAVIGFDESVLSVTQVEKLKASFRESTVKVSGQEDLVGKIWQDRPEIPQEPIFLHDVKFAGETRESKLQRIRVRLKKQGVQAELVTSLDDIAWMLNIRGSDIDFNPVAISYVVLTDWETRLFIHSTKVPKVVKDELEMDGVVFSEYEDIYSYWEQLPQGLRVLIDPEKTNYKLAGIISQTCKIKKGISIPYFLKAVKNETELDGIRNAHIRDGAAVVKWMYWLDHQKMEGQHTEITLADKLTEFRGQMEFFQGLSFGTISGYQANSAIGHYSPQIETTPTIKPEGILLVDSGGQYLDGTTDITRTMTLGVPTMEEKQVYTLVLKCLIKLSRAKFPQGTKGIQLDVLAREPMWQYGWNCRHGIGHGVGAFLNVHEGPQRFSPANNVSFEPGMITTNEPGVYFEGKFGVRLENVLVTISENHTEFGDFYGFETVTFCPFDLDLVIVSMLSEEEKAWLNQYHQVVYEKLENYLSQEEQEWLLKEIRKI
jgi:Xaa-Pro aminopeptidase